MPSRLRPFLRFERLWLGSVLLALAWVLVASDALQRTDNLLYDLDARLLLRSPPPQIAIVAIDDESLSALGRWPWPRRLHAQMIERLTQAGAKVIGMDILFAEPDLHDPDGDAFLARAIRTHGRVVLPVAPAMVSGKRLGETRPIAVLAQAAQLGHVDVELDPDGIVRSVYLRAGIGRPHWPALALAMLELGEPARAKAYAPAPRSTVVPDVASEWVREYRLLMRFFDHASAFSHLSFVSVLRGDAAALERIRDRYVLVGVTAAGIGQSLATPVSGLGAPMPGVDLTANVLANLMERAAVAPMTRSSAMLLTALLVLLPVFVYPHLRPRAALEAYGALLLLTLLLSFALLHLAQVWFAPSGALGAVALSYPLWSWRRLDASASALSAERNLARATLRCIGDAVVTTDRDGHVVYLNPVAQALCGRTPAEAAGRPLQDIVLAYDETGERRVVPPLYECLIEGRVVQPTRYCLLRGRESEHAIRWSAAPIRDDAGVVAGMVLAFSDVTETLSLSREMVRQATHDALTGLPNRVLVEDRLENAIARARRANNQVGVIFIDLDGFKKVNDAFGHAAGDALLKEVAVRLKGGCREEDTVARWGGDEFVVVLENVHEHEAVASRAGKMLELLSTPVHALDHEVYVTGSIGISLYPRDGEDVGGLFKRADAALYRAKEDGRNVFRFYSEEMSERAMQRVALEKSLWNALRNNELLLYYQPQFDGRNGRITGVEALLRWQTGDGEPMLPGRFLSIAEQSDLIHAIGDWVLQTACAQLAQFRDWGVGDLHVAVNLAPRQLHKRALYPRIAAMIREQGLDSSRLVLELSEDLFLQEASGIEQSLRGLREIGVRVSIDDFGTGYSSIGYLKRLPIDQVKIDKSFVRDVPEGADDSAIVRGIITLAHSLRLEVIAEGVENEAQLHFLKDLECDGIQGFYLSRPLPAQVLHAYLSDRARAH
jgi:diguanylate cyclase (GGDEF)-like protein/PAS domain S-box-containing protein